MDPTPNNKPVHSLNDTMHGDLTVPTVIEYPTRSTTMTSRHKKEGLENEPGGRCPPDPLGFIASGHTGRWPQLLSRARISKRGAARNQRSLSRALEPPRKGGRGARRLSPNLPYKHLVRRSSCVPAEPYPVRSTNSADLQVRTAVRFTDATICRSQPIGNPSLRGPRL